MELWDLLDGNRNPIGRTMVRGDEVPDGLYHDVVSVWMRNDEGKYLISRRAASRPSYPLYWESAGGSVTAGEDIFESALREVFEEVGVKLNPEDGRLVKTFQRETVGNVKYNDFVNVYLFKFNGEADLNAATTDEVEQTRWCTKEEVYELFENGSMVPELKEFFKEIVKREA